MRQPKILTNDQQFKSAACGESFIIDCGGGTERVSMPTVPTRRP